MKKFALALAAFTLFSATSAMAMDSATLLAHPDRYRVIHADDEEICYADMKSLSGMQTMDFPGSIENIDFTLYVESLKKRTPVTMTSRMEISRPAFVNSRSISMPISVKENTPWITPSSRCMMRRAMRSAV